jgi:hypothetical protein
MSRFSVEVATVDQIVQRPGGPIRKKNGHPRKRQLLLAMQEQKGMTASQRVANDRMTVPSESKGTMVHHPPTANGGSTTCLGCDKQISCLCCCCQGAEHATQERHATNSSLAWSPSAEPDMGALAHLSGLRD